VSATVKAVSSLALLLMSRIWSTSNNPDISSILKTLGFGISKIRSTYRTVANIIVKKLNIRITLKSSKKFKKRGFLQHQADYLKTRTMLELDPHGNYLIFQKSASYRFCKHQFDTNVCRLTRNACSLTQNVCSSRRKYKFRHETCVSNTLVMLGCYPNTCKHVHC
jgi:hypothetical protein